MSYIDTINKAKAKATEKKTAEERLKASEQEARNKAEATLNALYTSIVIEELNKAQQALKSSDLSAELSNEKNAEGSRFNLNIEARTLTLQAFTLDKSVIPRLCYYLDLDDLYPFTSIREDEQVGSGTNFTREQVQRVINDFISDAIANPDTPPIPF